MNFALFPRVWVPEDTAPGRSVPGAGRLANRLSRPGEDGSRNQHPADREPWLHLRRPLHSKLLNCRRIDPGAPGRGSERAVQRGHRHIQRDSSCRQAISGPAATVPNLLSPLSGELPQPVLAKIPETGMNGTSDTMAIGRYDNRSVSRSKVCSGSGGHDPPEIPVAAESGCCDRVPCRRLLDSRHFGRRRCLSSCLCVAVSGSCRRFCRSRSRPAVLSRWLTRILTSCREAWRPPRTTPRPCTRYGTTAQYRPRGSPVPFPRRRMPPHLAGRPPLAATRSSGCAPTCAHRLWLRKAEPKARTGGGWKTGRAPCPSHPQPPRAPRAGHDPGNFRATEPEYVNRSWRRLPNGPLLEVSPPTDRRNGRCARDYPAAMSRYSGDA